MVIGDYGIIEKDAKLEYYLNSFPAHSRPSKKARTSSQSSGSIDSRLQEIAGYIKLYLNPHADNGNFKKKITEVSKFIVNLSERTSNEAVQILKDTARYSITINRVSQKSFISSSTATEMEKKTLSSDLKDEFIYVLGSDPAENYYVNKEFIKRIYRDEQNAAEATRFIITLPSEKGKTFIKISDLTNLDPAILNYLREHSVYGSFEVYLTPQQINYLPQFLRNELIRKYLETKDASLSKLNEKLGTQFCELVSDEPGLLSEFVDFKCIQPGDVPIFDEMQVMVEIEKEQKLVLGEDLINSIVFLEAYKRQEDIGKNFKDFLTSGTLLQNEALLNHAASLLFTYILAPRELTAVEKEVVDQVVRNYKEPILSNMRAFSVQTRESIKRELEHIVEFFTKYFSLATLCKERDIFENLFSLRDPLECLKLTKEPLALSLTEKIIDVCKQFRIWEVLPEDSTIQEEAILSPVRFIQALSLSPKKVQWNDLSKVPTPFEKFLYSQPGRKGISFDLKFSSDKKIAKDILEEVCRIKKPLDSIQLSLKRGHGRVEDQVALPSLESLDSLSLQETQKSSKIWFERVLQNLSTDASKPNALEKLELLDGVSQQAITQNFQSILTNCPKLKTITTNMDLRFQDPLPQVEEINLLNMKHGMGYASLFPNVRKVNATVPGDEGLWEAGCFSLLALKQMEELQVTFPLMANTTLGQKEVWEELKTNPGFKTLAFKFLRMSNASVPDTLGYVQAFQTFVANNPHAKVVLSGVCSSLVLTAKNNHCFNLPIEGYEAFEESLRGNDLATIEITSDKVTIKRYVELA